MFLESKNNLDSPNSAAFEAANRDTERDEIILQVESEEGLKESESDLAIVVDSENDDVDNSDSESDSSIDNDTDEENEERETEDSSSDEEEERHTDENLESEMEVEEEGRISRRADISSSDEEIHVAETVTQPKRIKNQELFRNFPEETKDMTVDEVGREHFSCPRSGNGHMFLASAQIHPSTAQEHVNDIINVFQANPEMNKPFLCLITDDGTLDFLFIFLKVVFR